MLEDYPVRRALMLYGLKILIVASDLQIPYNSTYVSNNLSVLAM